jgi:hypothetical protein
MILNITGENHWGETPAPHISDYGQHTSVEACEATEAGATWTYYKNFGDTPIGGYTAYPNGFDYWKNCPYCYPPLDYCTDRTPGGCVFRLERLS